MAHSEKRTFSLPPAQAAYIDALVERGSYGSASEVVRAGLRALQERDAAIEQWLRKEVVPTAAEMMSDPSRGISIKESARQLTRLGGSEKDLKAPPRRRPTSR